MDASPHRNPDFKPPVLAKRPLSALGDTGDGQPTRDFLDGIGALQCARAGQGTNHLDTR